ncbi:MAG: glutamate-5-semialdehyde dehydrogenase, partial [Candidatus Omnitrophica bacterium]|nr:glutamate-5-semialdehyde dehydrogenase [Candidatus Omnitrophota bacterium]
MGTKQDILSMAKASKKASLVLGNTSTDEKNRAIKLMAKAISDNASYILRENKKDMKCARAKRINASLLDRLELNAKRIQGMVSSLQEIAKLDDVVGKVDQIRQRPNGLLIGKMRVPIGVIGIIYEARPNVTSDCVGLCLKSGNSVILKGGSEALNSNIAIFKCLRNTLSKTSIPQEVIALIMSKERRAVMELLKLNDYVDLIMPRGGEGLIKEVTENSRIPVIKHYKGVCHVYVDEYADLNMAHKIALNAKIQRPGVCNAMETLLVHKDVAARFLPVLAGALKKAGVEMRGCKKTALI